MGTAKWYKTFHPTNQPHLLFACPYSMGFWTLRKKFPSLTRKSGNALYLLQTKKKICICNRSKNIRYWSTKGWYHNETQHSVGWPLSLWSWKKLQTFDKKRWVNIPSQKVLDTCCLKKKDVIRNLPCIFVTFCCCFFGLLCKHTIPCLTVQPRSLYDSIDLRSSSRAERLRKKNGAQATGNLPLKTSSWLQLPETNNFRPWN